MRISDWSSDVCSSDLPGLADRKRNAAPVGTGRRRAGPDGRGRAAFFGLAQIQTGNPVRIQPHHAAHFRARYPENTDRYPDPGHTPNSEEHRVGEEYGSTRRAWWAA